MPGRRLVPLVMSFGVLAGAAGVFVPPAVGSTASRPTVTGVSPAAGTARGGFALTITGSGVGAATTVLFGSRSSTRITKVLSPDSIVVTAPAHAVSYVHVRVVTAHGRSGPTHAGHFRFAATPRQLHGAAGNLVTGPGSYLVDISCPSVSFCAAIDLDGNAYTYAHGDWGMPTHLGPASSGARVSCASSAFCVALLSTRDAVVYDHGVWGPPHALEAHRLESVACPSATFCMVGDDGGWALSYDGSSWSAPVKVSTHALYGLSCPTTRTCVAASYVSQHGVVFRYSGHVWGTKQILGEQTVLDVSCSSATSCAAVDVGGRVYFLNGTTWSAAQRSGYLTESGDRIECASPSFCVSSLDLDTHGRKGLLSFDGATIRRSTGIRAPAASCPTASMCVVIDGRRATVVS